MLTRKSRREQLPRAKLSSTLKNSVVIVTGASSGIGAATASEFARHGAQVILVARRGEELAIQVQTITDKGYNAIAIPTDITDAIQVTQLVEQTLAQFGRIDVLVNNAGTGRIRPFFKQQPTVLENILKCMYFQNHVLKENA